MHQIFIFRRDLRIHDNNTLNHLLQFPEPIIPIFIFDPIQINPKKNKYFSNNCVQFMCESLDELSKEISENNGSLNYFNDDPVKVLKKIIKKMDICRIGFNMDYTNFSCERDEKIKKFCDDINIQIITLEDITILPVGSIKTGSNTIYQKFTPFYNKAKKNPIPIPKTNKLHFANINLGKKINIHKFYKKNPNILHKGGRTNAISQFTKIPTDYIHTHDIPSIATTEMSAYNKFGCISIREFCQHVKNQKAILRQLYFRDFYYNVYYFNKKLFQKTSNPKFLHIKWDNPDNKLKLFYSGQTGFPIIDAGIKQMLKTGFMHNRVRMLVASFLSKDLLYDWKIGEHFFSTNLYDYDPIQNNAGWQTVAGTGVSALEWFRVMNPWTQTKKFDPECIYIKEWIPELRKVPINQIINWDTEYDDKIYFKPIVNHNERRDIMLKRYKESIQK